MHTPRPGTVRIALCGIFAVLASLFTLSTVRSQPPVGPPRPGGISGMPGGLPPRPSGLPPRPSGISGMPGGLPPRPGGVTGMPGGVSGGIGGITGIGGTPRFGPPQYITIWRCGRCKTELGRGPVAPNITTCTHCGVRLHNPHASGGGLTNPPGEAPQAPPAAGDTTPFDTNEVPLTDPSSESTATAPPVSGPPAGDASDGRGSLILKIALFLVAFVVLLGVLFVIVMVLGSRTHKHVRRRRVDDDY